MTTPVLITHESALELYRYAALLHIDVAVTDRVLAPGYPSRSDLAALEDSLKVLLGGFRLSRPIHIGTASTSRRSFPGFAVHSICSQLPRHSVYRLAENVLLASPSLAFIQMARKRSVVQSAVLAMEYCGTFALTPNGQVRYGIPQLMSVDDLMRIPLRQAGMHGASRAKRALRYAQDGSASPRESQFYLALCMPTQLGGAGVRAPQMNYEVECSEQARRIAGRRTLRCDLCWPREKLDVEYQSREFHTGDESRVRDSRRANALHAMGFTVIHVTNSELSTIADFNVIAGNIKGHLGIRNRVRAKDYERKQMALRRELGLSVAFG